MKSLVNRKKTNITYYNDDSYNYRVGDSMGYESEYQSFRPVIFYFQLSSSIDINKVKEVICIIIIDANRCAPKDTRLCTLFLNDENYKLIYTLEKNILQIKNFV